MGAEDCEKHQKALLAPSWCRFLRMAHWLHRQGMALGDARYGPDIRRNLCSRASLLTERLDHLVPNPALPKLVEENSCATNERFFGRHLRPRIWRPKLNSHDIKQVPQRVSAGWTRANLGFLAPCRILQQWLYLSPLNIGHLCYGAARGNPCVT